MLFSETRTKDGKQTVFNYPGPRPIDLKLIASWIGRAYPLAADPNHLVIDTIAHNVSLPLQNGHILTNNPSEQVTCLDINSLVDQQRKLDIQSENDPANFTHYFGLVYDGGDASKYFVEGCSPILDRNDPAYKSKLFTYIGTAPTGPKGPDAVPWRDGLIDSRWDKDGSYGDWYTGHELGHLLGRYHPDKYDADERVCERPEGAIGDGFPFEKGQLSNPGDPYYVGFDSGDLNPVSQVQGVSLHPKVMPGEKWHDIMTYCVRQWASSAAYESIRLRLEDERNAIPVELHGALKTGTLANGPASRTSLQPVTFVTETRPRRDSLVTLAASEVPSTNFIAIGATLNLTQITGKIDYISQVPTGKLPSASEGSLARIRLKDKDGKTIHEYAITVAMLSQRHTKDHIGVVSETIPYSEQIATLELVLSDKVIDVRRVSNHPPQVLRIDLPRIDERRFLTEPIVFKWVAKDDDQEALTYSVQLTLDEGRTWRTIAVRLPQPELSVRSDQFGNAPTAMIRVIANDGFLSATLTSAPLLLPNRVQPGGTIVGKVTFSGRPERKEFSFAKFPNSRFCQKNPHKELINGDRRFMPTIELAKDGGLKNAVVAMVDVEDLAFVDGYQGTEVLAEFCDFLPLIGVVVSSKNIHVENRDADSDDPQSSQGVLHNIHSYTVKGATSATDFNIRLAKKGDMLDKPVTFRGGSERVGYYRLQCDQHEFMQSFFLPVSNPHFTVVKDDGTFEITNVPVGMHKLVAWHPFAGRVEVEVDVPEGGTTNVKLAIKR